MLDIEEQGEGLTKALLFISDSTCKPVITLSVKRLNVFYVSDNYSDGNVWIGAR